MAEDDTIRDIENDIDSAEGVKRRTSKRTPSYQVIGDSKIPVSKSYGKIWKSRASQAEKATRDARDAWAEAIRYFENDQSGHRLANEGASGNVLGTGRLNDSHTETENVVFANVTTMVPALYARNPKVEFTTRNETLKDLNVLLERVVNEVINKRTSPGVNLKSKAKRCVVAAALCNRAYIEIGWTFKNASSEEALADLSKLAEQLQKAKDSKKIEEIEGKIAALEDSVDVLRPSGPFSKYKKPQDVLVDPNGQEPDLSDCNWIIVYDMFPTAFLLARYADKKNGTDEYKSLFQPTHIMKAKIGDDEGVEEEGEDAFSLWTDENEENMNRFGFDDEDSFNKSKMTKVAMVWDKTTRRVFMYNTKDWTWPIWVWDDPLQLDQFFPLYPLWFYENLDNNRIKGEVTYYLDQQDAINEMVDEERRARAWIKRNIIFNLNVVSQEDVNLILNGPDGTAKGVKVDPEVDMDKVIGSIKTPGYNHKELFDKEAKYRAIDRISSVGEVLRGTQFKTNTTNDAVNANVTAQNMRVDEKSDQIEDWIGRIGWGLAQLCMMNMEKDQVSLLVDEASGTVWQNFSAGEIQRTFHSHVVGGSGKKPTSQAKKEEALELGQVLGQFAQIHPIVLKIMLEAMQEAFDEVTVTDEDWQTIIDTIQAGPQGTQSQTTGGPQTGQAPSPSPNGTGQEGNDNQQANSGNVDAILAQLPPQAKQQIVQLIQSGIPAEQALAQVDGAANGATQQ